MDPRAGLVPDNLHEDCTACGSHLRLALRHVTDARPQSGSGALNLCRQSCCAWHFARGRSRCGDRRLEGHARCGFGHARVGGSLRHFRLAWTLFRAWRLVAQGGKDVETLAGASVHAEVRFSFFSAALCLGRTLYVAGHGAEGVALCPESSVPVHPAEVPAPSPDLADSPARDQVDAGQPPSHVMQPVFGVVSRGCCGRCLGMGRRCLSSTDRSAVGCHGREIL